MRLLNKKLLLKLKRKNRGNMNLQNALDSLVDLIERNEWKNPQELREIRMDADCVHPDGFYFFNISIHRALILMEFVENEATVVWAGTHQDYERVFRNNKRTIRAWLSANDWI